MLGGPQEPHQEGQLQQEQVAHGEDPVSPWREAGSCWYYEGNSSVCKKTFRNPGSPVPTGHIFASRVKDSTLTDKVATPTIFQLIGSAKKQLGPVGKGERNAQQGFNFRGIDTVVNAIAPVFDELGIITVPEVAEHEYDTVTIGAKQTQMGHVNLIVKYHFYGPDGDCVTATVASESMDAGDKCTAKAMSVAYRTALLQVLNLPTTDPDPDSESYERSPGKPAPKSAKPAMQTASLAVKPWNERIAAAGTTDELNAIWRDAGVVGALPEKVPNANGEMMTVKDLLYARKDELDLKSGV